MEFPSWCQELDRLADASVGLQGSQGSQLERPTVEADGRYDNQDEAGVNVHKLSSCISRKKGDP